MSKVKNIFESSKPLKKDDARKKINTLAQDSKNVLFTTHAKERMKQRDFLPPDVYRILKEGNIKRTPELREKEKLWAYRVEYDFSKTDKKACIVAIKGQKLILITVY